MGLGKFMHWRSIQTGTDCNPLAGTAVLERHSSSSATQRRGPDCGQTCSVWLDRQLECNQRFRVRGMKNGRAAEEGHITDYLVILSQSELHLECWQFSPSSVVVNGKYK